MQLITKTYLCLLVWLPLLTFASQLAQIEKEFGIETFSTPSLDSNLQLLGNISTLSFYKYTGQQNFTEQNTRSSLIYYSDDILIELIPNDQLSSNAMIKQIVPLRDNSFVLNGVGNLLNYDLSKQLVYNLTTLSVYPIFNESLNIVSTILVDNNIVYFGGNFTFQGSNSAYTWDSTSNTTYPLSFDGFGKDSTINSIVKLNDDEILFTGNFSTLGNNTYLTSSINNNTNVLNLTSIELEPLVSLKAAIWDVDSSSQFDSSNFICPSNKKESWSQSGTTGSFVVNLSYDVTPSKIRLYNSPNTDNEVSLFRIITNPSNSILNLTYLDPLSGNLQYCDAFCPLLTTRILNTQAQNDSLTIEDKVTIINGNSTVVKWSDRYQDFAFVNPVDVESLTFTALDSYGTNIGLGGLQLFQDSFNSFANNTLNEPNCDDEYTITSVSLSENDWKAVSNTVDYISTYYTPNVDPVPFVEFSVDLEYNGEYSINIYTPGCSDDGTCSSRGIVNITVWDTTDNSIISTKSIYQNNNQLKYDELYSGNLNISTCRITLTYQNGLYASTTPVTIVADRVSVSIVKLDTSDLAQLTSTSTKSVISLNGLLQYQLSNFTSTFSSSESPITVTPLTSYVNATFKKNSSILAELYDNNTLLLGSEDEGISVVKLNNDLSLESNNGFEVSGNVNVFECFSNGIFISGRNLNVSGEQSNNLIYNGTFHTFKADQKETSTTFANVSFSNSELLVLDSNFIWNVSSSRSITNDSSLSLGLWSSGKNSQDDTLLYGSVYQNQFANLDSAVSIDSNGTISVIDFPQGISPYLGLFLNSSSTVYAYESRDNNNKLYFSNNKQINNITSWAGPISSMLYSGNNSILIVGTVSSGSTSAQLTILNTTTLTVVNKEALQGSNSNITSMLNFETNSTLLIGGNFNLSNPDCNGICLYNYETQKFNSFANGTLTGSITSLQFYNDSLLLISGIYDTTDVSGITLSQYDIKKNELTPLRQDNTKLNSFITEGDRIISWNSTTLFIYQDNSWVDMQIPNINSSSVIADVSLFSGYIPGGSLSKRDGSNSTNKVLVVNGQFHSSQYGTIQSFVYDFDKWVPYLSVKAGLTEDLTVGPNFFVNEDTTYLFNSPVVLPNANSTITVPKTSSTSSGTSTNSATISSSPKKAHEGTKKIRRGFVVLVGLALALGTVAVLGLFGVLLAALFRDEEIKYEPLTPHIGEDDMINTVPPEKLMKFI
ncbi:similar to Saccharomyces cerevisiae YLR084C RAX2 N-glycosylated protein involved in the maintenance of bud site selection during bipolar budding [Maudiozyma barnettii]|uniref:Similar to Saccharomyces cerevisiae YLR084C RAX2 N-glycosylated protein involved in the maintenance of bud site selection during bipolar budding n=1 Tax=Maudiozyma barnettii TaxID=61262 RepID=A0A8H2ZI44_9SACH|nr:Rax2p [Kazachstania barnettii]CAB4255488.1 similar to Saccharomyces cerevisiae YLR084C RAX2 N-glycosylated protein involved in the maintenance of bud site selection during bipolar budding [Kazachstania barnettii]CAD1783979.1 similar to Saccharomyces cerevisiae YLR084C RAX2 N-glycosylated protein involved in the maintenance of bud site selection during bipolar budding [Kazachstania barnettii]